jgi:hypothetical protein
MVDYKRAVSTVNETTIRRVLGGARRTLRAFPPSGETTRCIVFDDSISWMGLLHTSMGGLTSTRGNNDCRNHSFLRYVAGGSTLCNWPQGDGPGGD